MRIQILSPPHSSPSLMSLELMQHGKRSINILFYPHDLFNRNRLLKAGIVDQTSQTPKRKVAILHTETGGNQSDTAHLPFRRPKNISLLDQLNRIDMIGFNRFLDAINGKNSDNSPQKHRPGAPSGGKGGPRRPSISSPRRLSVSAPIQSPQRQSPLPHGADDESIPKPSSSVAGTCYLHLHYIPHSI